MTDRPDPLDLSGKVVVVTGASGGIGAGIVQRFTAAGAAVVAGYRRNRPEPPSATGSRPGQGASSSWLAVEADLTASDGPDRLVGAAIDRFGRLDALVNNAASQDLVPLASMTDDQFSAMIAANLVAAHRLTQRAVPALADVGGSVVHIASIEGTTPAPAHAHYAVSKAALVMHAKAAALEYGHLGVRVNAVSPGLIQRPGLAEDWPDGVGRWQAAAPLGRLGSPADVADACLFLCSQMASWITGVDLVVDGGVSTHPHW
jgi:NAD(P)-dependent dehydrogenase (short-subunit alcohol dehydrogenase family)